MFTETRILLEQYYCALLPMAPSRRAKHLLSEVRGRLRRLQWVYSRLVALDEQLDTEARAALPASQPQPDVLKQVFTDTGKPDCIDLSVGSLPFSTADELAVLLEAFYYSAHRIRDILQDGRKDLPGFPTFEAKGVRDVRNHLVEHPSRAKGVLLPSFATGGPVGPQLRPLRWSLDPPGTHDAGLYANAAEFERHLNAALTTARDTCAA